MYDAATAVIVIPRTVSAVIEIASPHCSMERSVLKLSPLGLYAVRLARRNGPSLGCRYGHAGRRQKSLTEFTAAGQYCPVICWPPLGLQVKGPAGVTYRLGWPQN